MPGISDWKPDIFEINMGDMLLSVVDANESLEDIRPEMHFHSVFEFQYIKKGTLGIKTERKNCIVQEGQYVIIPHSCFHSPESIDTELERYAFLFSMNFLPKAKSEGNEYRFYNRIFNSVEVISVHKNSTVDDCVNRLMAEQGDGISVHRMKILFGMVIMAVAEDMLPGNTNAIAVDAVNETAYKQKLRGIVGDYISRFCNESDILASVAEILHMSERNTSRIIKDVFDAPLSVLVLKQRMSYAKELIQIGEMPLSLISEKVGYKHYNTFYKAFKKYYGVSPEEMKMTLSVF